MRLLAWLKKTLYEMLTVEPPRKGMVYVLKHSNLSAIEKKEPFEWDTAKRNLFIFLQHAGDWFCNPDKQWPLRALEIGNITDEQLNGLRVFLLPKPRVTEVLVPFENFRRLNEEEKVKLKIYFGNCKKLLDDYKEAVGVEELIF